MTPSEHNEIEVNIVKVCSAWPAALASLGFSLTSLYLMKIYGTLHWQILSQNYEKIDDGLKESLFTLLNRLEFYRIYGLVALIFLIIAFFGKPKWLALICTPFVVFSLFLSIIVT